MRNFYQVAGGIPVNTLMTQIMRQPELWNQNRFRTEFADTPHADVDDIWIRFSDPAKCTDTGTVIGDDHPIWHPAAKALPAVQPIVQAVMRTVDAYSLGRVLITKLRPGGRILPHTDKDGSYVQTADRSRYHVALMGLPGSLYRCGNETVTMLTGQCWWFRPDVEHEIMNNSSDDRIHLLIDVQVWP